MDCIRCVSLAANWDAVGLCCASCCGCSCCCYPVWPGCFNEGSLADCGEPGRLAWTAFDASLCVCFDKIQPVLHCWLLDFEQCERMVKGSPEDCSKPGMDCLCCVHGFC